MLESFLKEERKTGGWRFWILWVILTNIGFFAGILLEWAIFGSVNLVFAIPLAAAFQGWVLNRHIVSLIPWFLATTFGWWIGLLTSSLVLGMVMPEMNEILRFVLIGAWAGFIVGIPQWLVLRSEVPGIGLWWIAVSAVGWAGVVASPLITGIPLGRYIEYEYRDLIYRAWAKPETAGDKPPIATKAKQP